MDGAALLGICSCSRGRVHALRAQLPHCACPATQLQQACTPAQTHPTLTKHQVQAGAAPEEYSSGLLAEDGSLATADEEVLPELPPKTREEVGCAGGQGVGVVGGVCTRSAGLALGWVGMWRGLDMDWGQRVARDEER